MDYYEAPRQYDPHQVEGMKFPTRTNLKSHAKNLLRFSDRRDRADIDVSRIKYQD